MARQMACMGLFIASIAILTKLASGEAERLLHRRNNAVLEAAGFVSPDTNLTVVNKEDDTSAYVASFKWVINSYEAQNETRLGSNEFSASAMVMQLLLYPRGENGSEDFISLYLVAPRCHSWGHRDYAYVSWRFTVLNLRGLRPHHTEEVDHSFSHDASGWGLHDLLPRSSLLDPEQGWLDERGSLHLRMDVLRVLPHWIDYTGVERRHWEWVADNSKLWEAMRWAGLTDLMVEYGLKGNESVTGFRLGEHFYSTTSELQMALSARSPILGNYLATARAAARLGRLLVRHWLGIVAALGAAGCCCLAALQFYRAEQRQRRRRENWRQQVLRGVQRAAQAEQRRATPGGRHHGAAATGTATNRRQNPHANRHHPVHHVRQQQQQQHHESRFGSGDVVTPVLSAGASGSVAESSGGASSSPIAAALASQANRAWLWWFGLWRRQQPPQAVSPPQPPQQQAPAQQPQPQPQANQRPRRPPSQPLQQPQHAQEAPLQLLAPAPQQQQQQQRPEVQPPRGAKQQRGAQHPTPSRPQNTAGGNVNSRGLQQQPQQGQEQERTPQLQQPSQQQQQDSCRQEHDSQQQYRRHRSGPPRQHTPCSHQQQQQIGQERPEQQISQVIQPALLLPPPSLQEQRQTQNQQQLLQQQQQQELRQQPLGQMLETYAHGLELPHIATPGGSVNNGNVNNGDGARKTAGNSSSSIFTSSIDGVADCVPTSLKIAGSRSGGHGVGAPCASLTCDSFCSSVDCVTPASSARSGGGGSSNTSSGGSSVTSSGGTGRGMPSRDSRSEFSVGSFFGSEYGGGGGGGSSGGSVTPVGSVPPPPLPSPGALATAAELFVCSVGGSGTVSAAGKPVSALTATTAVTAPAVAPEAEAARPPDHLAAAGAGTAAAGAPCSAFNGPEWVDLCSWLLPVAAPSLPCSIAHGGAAPLGRAPPPTMQPVSYGPAPTPLGVPGPQRIWDPASQDPMLGPTGGDGGGGGGVSAANVDMMLKELRCALGPIQRSTPQHRPGADAMVSRVAAPGPAAAATVMQSSPPPPSSPPLPLPRLTPLRLPSPSSPGAASYGWCNSIPDTVAGSVLEPSGSLPATAAAGFREAALAPDGSNIWRYDPAISSNSSSSGGGAGGGGGAGACAGRRSGGGAPVPSLFGLPGGLWPIAMLDAPTHGSFGAAAGAAPESGRGWSVAQ